MQPGGVKHDMCDRLSHINEYNAQHEDRKTHHRTTRLATRRAMCGPLRGPVPYMGGCAGACRLLLHSVVSLSPRALMQPGSCGHDSPYPTRANGCSRRPRAWAWGDIADLVRCRAEGRVPERDRDCTYQVLVVKHVHLSPGSDTGTSQRPASSSAHGRWKIP